MGRIPIRFPEPWMVLPVAILVLIGCASDTADVEVEAPALEAACGEVSVPLAEPPVLPEEPLDADAEAALEALRNVGADPAILGQYTWVIAERTDAQLLLFGRHIANLPPGAPGFADASFSREGDRWVPDGFGQCRIEVSADGFGLAHWILDPTVELDPSADQLAIRFVEKGCAGGAAPQDRTVIPVVDADEVRVTIRILVESIGGFATCQSNPWVDMTVDLGEPPGERPLLDGAVIPALVRVWPPTRSSLDSFGSQS